MVDYGKLRRSQILESELLKTFRDICNKEHLQYFLLGGSALGAIRHNGFIPWDDDIDVGLMRDDYDKFISVATRHLQPGEKILHYTLDPNYHDYSMKLVDTKVFYLTQRDNSVVRQNIWIDIFPIDGTPSSKIRMKLHYLNAYYTRMLLALNHINTIHQKEKRSLFKRAIISIARIIPVGLLVNPNKVKKKIDRILRKYPVSQSAIVGNYIGAYHEKEFFPISYFGEGREVVFEGEKYLVPQETDLYLTQLYGDYMRLPEKEKQVPTHNVLDVIEERDLR